MVFASRSIRHCKPGCIRSPARDRQSWKPFNGLWSNGSPAAPVQSFQSRLSSSPTCWSTKPTTPSTREIYLTAATRLPRLPEVPDQSFRRRGHDLLRQRQSAKPINTVDHIRFWAEWIRDNNGRLKQATKLRELAGWQNATHPSGAEGRRYPPFLPLPAPRCFCSLSPLDAHAFSLPSSPASTRSM